MARNPLRTRIFPSPHASALFDAHIETIHNEPTAHGSDLLIELETFQPTGPITTSIAQGSPLEYLSGVYTPKRLRFVSAQPLRRTGVYEPERFAEIPPHDPARQLFGVMHGRNHDLGEFYWLTTGAIVTGELTIHAKAALLEDRPGQPHTAERIRRWAPTPPTPPGLLPHRPKLYERFGGDSIAIHLRDRRLHNRLFIGGLAHQRDQRPAVDAILNLCGVENPWCAKEGWRAYDRFAQKGEMAAGMDIDDLLSEASWVVERLRLGRRVLVHCFAGINRSSSVCCATLILLEGISAEAALARVRETHPNAWPDPYHWFLLRWLAQTNSSGSLATRVAQTEINVSSASPDDLQPRLLGEPVALP